MLESWVKKDEIYFETPCESENKIKIVSAF